MNIYANRRENTFFKISIVYLKVFGVNLKPIGCNQTHFEWIN